VSDEIMPLSDRELEILQLVSTGATNQQVAQDLVISINTVKVHLRNIYSKLEVSSRTEATMIAVREGWVQVPGLEGQAETVEAAQETETTLPPPLPRLERWPLVAPAKRVSLLAAALLATMFLFLPVALQSRSNGNDADPIRGAFPTASPRSSAPRWHTRAQMPTPRTGLAVVDDEGLIYAIGGVSNDGATGKVEVYDPQADGWSVRRTKPTLVGIGGRASLPCRRPWGPTLWPSWMTRSISLAGETPRDTWLPSTAMTPQPIAGRSSPRWIQRRDCSVRLPWEIVSTSWVATTG
jgi:DNA-binding CsgD family transcriptional regulator